MSSFKKLRLDPELPSAHRNQSGANDSGGRGFLDGSSFSSSTSGGSGAYGRNSGPFRTRYSQPFGAPSSSSSSFSRFAPYYFGKERRTSLRVPLIRARRDDSDSEGCRPSSRASLNSSLGGDSTTSATSSTAQRIIETLQNLSTPVMNAGKIRIDQDIKAVQPLTFGSGASLSRISPGSSFNRSSGPPKMRSSLLLTNPSPANQTTPIFGSGDPRRLFCIPKMVDAATNTEKEEISSPPQMNFINKSIVSPSPGKSQFTGTSLKPVVSNSSKDDNHSEEEFYECNSEFAFSNPWAPDVFDRFLTSCKEDKSVNKGNMGMQLPLINGFKDTTSTSFEAPQVSSKSISFSGSTGTSPQLSGNTTRSSSVATSNVTNFSGSLGTKGIGSSPLNNVTFGKSQASPSLDKRADTPNSLSSEIKSGTSPMAGFSFGKPTPQNKSESSNIALLGNLPAKDNKTAATSSIDKVDAPKSDNPSTSKSSSDSKSTLPPLSSLNKISAKWRCPTCMVENDPVVAACVCCGEKSTNQATVKATSTDKKKWKCPICMVENEHESASCVCCTEKNPNPVVVSTPLSSLVVASKKWRCSTCMVENEPAAAKCVCCSEKNPNPVAEKNETSNAVVTTSATTFKFGVSNSVASSSAAPAGNSSFVFGARSDNQQAPPAAFHFGCPITTSITSPVSTTSSVPSAPSQSASAASSTFKFGSVSTSSSSATTPSFGFNLPSTTTGSQATTPISTVTTASSGSIFSAPKVSVSSTTTSTGGVFGSPNFQATQSNTVSSFKFGSTAPTATSEAHKSGATPSFSFGAADSSKPQFNKNTFSFGDSGGLPGANSSILSPPAPTPAPSAGGASNFNFGSNNSTASPFGQLQSIAKSPPQPSTGGLFQFGSGTSSNPQPPSLTPAPAPSFSLTPNLNFGATPGITIPFGNPTQPTPNAGSQPPPSLFQFSSTPSDPAGGRKIKKAVRRFKN